MAKCGGDPWWTPLEVTMMRAQNKSKEDYLKRHSDVNDPLNPRVKHIVHHNNDGSNNISKKTDGLLQKKINKAISKIMDMNLLESDRKELVKILTE